MNNFNEIIIEKRKILNNEKQNVKVLTVQFPPSVVTYLDHTFPVSIIRAHENGDDVFFSNYIQMYWDDTPNHKFNFYPVEPEKNLFLERIYINSKIISFSKDDIIDYFIKWIDNNFYISARIIEAEIPNTAMQKRNLYVIHECLFFGYNKNKNHFYMLNFDKDFNFSIINVSFESLIKSVFGDYTRALNNTWWLHESEKKEGFFPLFKLLRFQWSTPTFEKEKIKDTLQEFINGENSFIGLNNRKYKNNFTWGIKLYDRIDKYLNDNSGQEIDYRIFHGLWEHKVIMRERLDYIEDHMNICYNQKDNFEKIIEIAKILKMLSMKYNLNKNKTLIEKIRKKISILKEEEHSFLIHVVNKL